MIACTCFSADVSCGPDFCLIFTPRISYDEPEILLKQFGRSVSQSLTGNNGQEGGYALCFNQPKLLEMFSNEPNGGQYKTLYTKSVSYGAVHWPNDLKDEARRYVLNLVKQKFDSQYENIQKYLTERFMAVLISTKSRAFHEECERRIVAVTDNTIADGALKKEVKFKSRGGGIIPYIELFKNVGKLPIERIVVGPHPNQERRAELLRVYLAAKGYANVRVTSSAIQILLFP